MTERVRHPPTVRVEETAGPVGDELAARLADVLIAAVREAARDDAGPDLGPGPAEGPAAQ